MRGLVQKWGLEKQMPSKPRYKSPWEKNPLGLLIMSSFMHFSHVIYVEICQTVLIKNGQICIYWECNMKKVYK